MPAYDINDVMPVFYQRLEELGFEMSHPPVPDKWQSEQAGMQIWISHAGFASTIKYRRTPASGEWETPAQAHAIEAQIKNDRSHGWNSITRAHSGTSQDFARWLGQAVQTIETSARAYGSVAVAPGE